MKNGDIVKEWIKYSMMDLSSAHHLYATMLPKPIEIICYHCQQSAEKILKAFLLSNNWELERTHDLRKLCMLSEQFNETFIDIRNEC